MKTFQYFLQLCLVASLAEPSPHRPPVTKPPTHAVSRIVSQFPMPTWLENIAATRNGSLLTGQLGGAANLYLIDPMTNKASLAYNFTSPSTNAVFGIAELSPDVWIIMTGHFADPLPTPGSNILWKVDMTSGREVKAEKIIELKDSQLANGLAIVNEKIFLFTDSLAGNIGRISLGAAHKNGTATATYDVALMSPNLEPNASAIVPLGGDGLKYRAPYLYWTQTWSGRIVRAKISPTTGLRVGDDELLTDGLPDLDDIVLTEDGKTLYVVQPFANSLTEVVLPKAEGEKAGQPRSVIGGEGTSVIPGATAVTFGRGKHDKDVLYVCTLGGYTGVNRGGTNFEGGKVIAVYLDGTDGCA